MKIASPARFIKKQAYRLARASYTPVPFWLDMTIKELFRWIAIANEVDAEDEAEAKRQNGEQ